MSCTPNRNVGLYCDPGRVDSFLRHPAAVLCALLTTAWRLGR